MCSSTSRRASTPRSARSGRRCAISPEAPTFVETVPGKGYRFIAPVDEISTAPVAELKPAPASPPRIPYRARLAVGVAVVAIATGLVAWTFLSGAATTSRVSLAVLPFENLGNDPEREYLAAGLTQETSASLAQIDPARLSVKGRTLHYKGTTKAVSEIGQELSVDYLVESTIRAEGGRTRVTSTLIRVRDQEHVWSQSFEREATSLLGLQQELSMAIAEQIRVRLSPDQSRGLGRRQTHNADAYDAYLRGRHFESRRARATNALAVEQYRRAVALDPDYALAWSRLAFTYAGSAVNADAPPLQVWPDARAAAEQAVRANPNLAEAQFAVAYVNWMLDWNWPAAQTAFRLSIRLDPSNADAHRMLGHSLSQTGRHSEAESSMRRDRELEPLEPLSHALSAQVAYQGRDVRAAVEHARRAILIDSIFWIGYIQLGQAYEGAGEVDLALEALRDAERFSGGNSKTISLKGYVLAKTGRATEAREVLRTLEAGARERYVPPYAMALVHAGLGEREAVFEWLEKAYAAHDIHLIYLPVDAKWDAYRTDPRFAALLARCGFTQKP